MSKVKKKRLIVGELILGAVIICMAVAQTSFFSHFKLWDAVPNVALAFLCAYSVFGRPGTVCFTAVITGFILGCLGSGTVIYYPITFLISACVGALFSKTITKSPFISAALTALIAFVSDGLVSVALTVYMYKTVSFGSVFIHSFLPSFGYSVLIFIPVYLICRFHHRIFD